jgi:putative ABC transport system ATP-binding protein
MLSGGQQQRVAIARALGTPAKMILADEPTGNLDTENSRNVIGLLKRLSHEQGYCVVVVTHDALVAEQADVQLTMQDGRLIN